MVLGMMIRMRWIRMRRERVWMMCPRVSSLLTLPGRRIWHWHWWIIVVWIWVESGWWRRVWSTWAVLAGLMSNSSMRRHYHVRNR
jgi:hypothetical protein